jgi:hypothetical protein
VHNGTVANSSVEAALPVAPSLASEVAVESISVSGAPSVDELFAVKIDRPIAEALPTIESVKQDSDAFNAAFEQANPIPIQELDEEPHVLKFISEAPPLKYSEIDSSETVILDVMESSLVPAVESGNSSVAEVSATAAASSVEVDVDVESPSDSNLACVESEVALPAVVDSHPVDDNDFDDFASAPVNSAVNPSTDIPEDAIVAPVQGEARASIELSSSENQTVAAASESLGNSDVADVNSTLESFVGSSSIDASADVVAEFDDFAAAPAAVEPLAVSEIAIPQSGLESAHASEQVAAPVTEDFSDYSGNRIFSFVLCQFDTH